MKDYIGKYRIFFRGADPIIATADPLYQNEMSKNDNFKCIFSKHGVSFWEPTIASVDPKTGELLTELPERAKKIISKLNEL